MRLPLVTIVGRPNVGKSTLFNRITGRRHAIEDGMPGVTRDAIEGRADWNGRAFTVVDTAGYDDDIADLLKERILAKVRERIEGSDVAVALVDGRDGLTAGDRIFCDLLRRTGKPAVLAVNKIDSGAGEEEMTEFYALGLGDPVAVSAMHGAGVGDLLDRVAELLPPAEAEAEGAEKPLSVAIVGQPNAGKSSLLNAILGYDRTLVHDVPGTTRDSIDTELSYEGRPVTLIDTAGIRKRFRRGERLEYLACNRSHEAIDRCDIALLVVDLARGLTHYDKSIAERVQERGKGLVIALNKIDLVHDFRRAREAIDAQVDAETPFLKNVPHLYVSAKSGAAVGDCLGTCFAIRDEALAVDIPTSELNSILREMVSTRPPVSRKGRQLKVFYGTLAAKAPPVLILFVNDDRLLLKAYRKYLENGFRSLYPFRGYPFILKTRNRRGED